MKIAQNAVCSLCTQIGNKLTCYKQRGIGDSISKMKSGLQNVPPMA